MCLRTCCPAKHQSAVLLTNRRLIALETAGTVGQAKAEYRQTSYFVAVRVWQRTVSQLFGYAFLHVLSLLCVVCCVLLLL